MTYIVDVVNDKDHDHHDDDDDGEEDWNDDRNYHDHGRARKWNHDEEDNDLSAVSETCLRNCVSG